MSELRLPFKMRLQIRRRGLVLRARFGKPRDEREQWMGYAYAGTGDRRALDFLSAYRAELRNGAAPGPWDAFEARPMPGQVPEESWQPGGYL